MREVLRCAGTLGSRAFIGAGCAELLGIVGAQLPALTGAATRSEGVDGLFDLGASGKASSRRVSVDRVEWMLERTAPGHVELDA